MDAVTLRGYRMIIAEENINEETYKPYHSIRDVSQVNFVEDEDKTSTSYWNYYSCDHWAKAIAEALITYLTSYGQKIVQK
jgi:hypothetical protein